MSSRTLATIAAALVVVGLLATWVLTRGRSAPPPSAASASSGAAQEVIIVPFTSQTPAHRQLADAIADSLAARLTQLPGLSARVARDGSKSADLSVKGDIAAESGRLVIAARLLGPTPRDTFWTATFWRPDSLTAQLVTDLAEDIAGAIFGRLVRAQGGARPEKAP